MHTLIDFYLSLSKQYPAVIGAFSLWFLGMFSYYGKSLPDKIKQFFYNRFVTRVIIDEAAGDTSAYTFSISQWIFHNVTQRHIRSFLLDKNPYTGAPMLAMGQGSYIFWYKGAFIFVTTWYKEKEHTTYKMMSISTLGISLKSKQRLMDLVTAASVIGRPRQIYQFDRHRYSADWTEACAAPDRNLSTLVYEDDILQKTIDDIKDLEKQEDFYTKFNIPYKKCYLLEGPPGTGKTSFVQAVATVFNAEIYTLSLSGVDDQTLHNLLSKLSKTKTFKVLLLEDIDSLKTLHKRTDDTSEKEKPGTLSLQGYLNSFGGVIPLKNLIIFITTNHVEKLDPAVIRPGRVDKILHIGALSDQAIREYILQRYDTSEVRALLEKTPAFSPLRGSVLENVFLETLKQPDQFIAKISELAE